MGPGEVRAASVEREGARAAKVRRREEDAKAEYPTLDAGRPASDGVINRSADADPMLVVVHIVVARSLYIPCRVARFGCCARSAFFGM